MLENDKIYCSYSDAQCLKTGNSSSEFEGGKVKITVVSHGI